MVELTHVDFRYESEGVEMLASLARRDVPADGAPRRGDEDDADGRLHDISMRIEDGQFVLITGPSGCGKSTVLRLINGLIPHYYPGKLSGTVEIDGANVSGQELYETGQVVGTVFQNPRSQFFNVDTDSELAFSCENRGLDPTLIGERMDDTIARFGILDLMGRSIFKLSGGEKQKIACASVDVGRPRAILLDEPSANLDYESTVRLRELVALWKEKGCTIIAAEHRIAYLWDLVDRVIIMDRGRIVSDLDAAQAQALTAAQITELGLRSTVFESPADVDLPPTDESAEHAILHDFTFTYRQGLFPRGGRKRREEREPAVDFSGARLALGRITAVVGANGAGKSTLLRCLCGLERRCRGTLEWAGEHHGRNGLLGSVFMVMQDVNHQLFTESVLEELLITMASDGGDADERRARAILARLDLDRFADRHPMSLSGGQKQRLAVACALASARDILLFDEPTSGLDYRHMMQTAALLSELRALGKTIVVVTHDSELIRACCDCKLSVANGRPA